MATQSSPLLTLSRDAVSALRRRIRAPLHQVLSYTEIIVEDVGHEKYPTIYARLSGIIATCEAVLQLAAAFIPDVDGLEASVDKLRGELMDHCRDLLTLSAELQSAAPAEQFASLQTDIERIRVAARAFEELVNGMSPEKVLTLATSDTRPALSGDVLRQRADRKTINQESTPAKPNSNAIRGGVVLVVDDDEGNRDVLSRRLLRDGCEVMLAETGRQALRMARRYAFDLVLLDIMMPEMDGIMVLAELRSDPKLCRLPVVMISAVDDIESVVRCIELGADDYLTKPFNPVLLRARVNALLDRKRLQDNEMKRTAELQSALSEIEEQRKKTESLLLNILPLSVAQELQTDGCVQPMYFEDVTIVFADFVGFTLSTEELAADELVNILNQYFTAFDNILKRYGMEKLKTIGDCYMFAGGLPDRSPSHPVDAIMVAFEMIRATQQMAQQGPVQWQLRIGVHTGPVVAGVVGLHKFAFDIWGDAVNFSSRMEASGAPGRVNLSPNTYARIKDFFSCEKRGKVMTKDGREVEMYFIKGIASGLRANKDEAPLASFKRRYRTYFRKELQTFPESLAEGAN